MVMFVVLTISYSGNLNPALRGILKSTGSVALVTLISEFSSLLKLRANVEDPPVTSEPDAPAYAVAESLDFTNNH